MLQSPSSGWRRPAADPPGRQLAVVGTPLLKQFSNSLAFFDAKIESYCRAAGSVLHSVISHADISEHAVLN